MSISKGLQKIIADKNHGWVFCANDFDSLGSKVNIDVILHRLSQKGFIRRLGYGLYDKPRKSNLLGDLSPDIQDIINTYARKMNQKFVLDPQNSANALGLTTQVPAKLIYLTDGKSHTITICGLDIHFIHTSPKKLAGAMTPVGVVIQALRCFSPKGPSEDIIKLLAKRLTPNDLDSLVGIRSIVMRNLAPQIDRIAQIATIY